MHESTATMNTTNCDAHRRRSQNVLRLFMAPAIALMLLGGFVGLVDSSGAAPAQETPWHSFSPDGWVNSFGVHSSVFLTSTTAPIQGTAHYSVSLDAGSNWVGPYNATLTNQAANRWRFETALVPVLAGENNRVRYAVNLTGGQRIQSDAYVVRVDVAVPSILITSPQAGAVISTANVTVRGTAEDALSGVGLVTASIGDRTLTPTLSLPNWSTAWPAPNEDGVAFTLTARAQDRAGNWASTTRTFTVDRVAPTIPTSIMETHGIANNAVLPSPLRLNFIWSGASGGSGIAGYFVYWGAESNGTGSEFVSIAAYAPPAMTQIGRHYLRVRTKDLAGNLAPWQTMFTVTLQSTTRTVFLPLVQVSHPWFRYESNNTIATAYGPLTSNQVYEAFIWPAGDQDYYFINVASTASDITVSLTNIPADADYDLYLYDSTPSLVASSAQYGSVNEFIRYRPVASGRYNIRIYPYQGANKDQPYRLTATFQ